MVDTEEPPRFARPLLPSRLAPRLRVVENSALLPADPFEESKNPSRLDAADEQHYEAPSSMVGEEPDCTDPIANAKDNPLKLAVCGSTITYEQFMFAPKI